MLCEDKPSSLALALLATTMLTQPGPAQAAPGDALGTEFQVNIYTAELQRDAAVALDADGDFVVAWESVDDYAPAPVDEVFLRRFDASGTPLSGEIRVNSFTVGEQGLPAIAMDADGDFVVVWQSYNQTNYDRFDIFAQRFDAVGTPQGSEISVNSYTTNQQSVAAVAMDADGDFVVAWSGYGDPEGSSWDVFAQRFDAAGNPQGPEIHVNSYTDGIQGMPAVAMDADGDFVVAWHSRNQYGDDDYGVFAQRFDASGAPQDTEFQVNIVTAGKQGFPAIAMKADGGFVVAWETAGQDGDGLGIYARRYDAAGAALGSEFPVNSSNTGDQFRPAAAMDIDGDFVVTWQTSGGQDGDSFGVFAQRYDAEGSPLGPEFQVNSYTTHQQTFPAVVMDVDGDFVVAWQSYGQDGSSQGVFAQRYDGVERTAGDFDGDGNEDLLWHNASSGLAIVWLMEGETKLAAQTIGKPPVAWQVAGVGEFNGDDKADILWHNSATGAALVWQMDGFTKVASVGIGKPPTAWVVEKVYDSNGDGLSDITWRNTDTDNTVVWEMLGYTKAATGSTGKVPAPWDLP